MFLVDGSGSICDTSGGRRDGTCDNWDRVKNFINAFIDDDQIVISPNDARVALVTFDNFGVVRWDLSK